MNSVRILAAVIAGLILLAVMGLLVLVFRWPAGAKPRRPLSTEERIYVWTSALPLVLTLTTPLIVHWTMGSGPETAEWSRRVTSWALWFSVWMTAVGIYFLARGRRSGTVPSRWVAAALIVTALPAALAAVVIVMLRT